MSFQKLSPDARRMRTIIVALPLIGVTSYILYKRLVLGESQRHISPQGPFINMSVKTTMPAAGRNAAETSQRTDADTGDNPERKTP